MPILTAERTNPDFEMTITDSTGNSMVIDIPVDQGGNGNGMRPMQTVLAALCGCSAVDVVSILKKQKQTLTGFKITVDGEREKARNHPFGKLLICCLSLMVKWSQAKVSGQ